MKKIIQITAISLLFCWSLSCAVNPVSGERELMLYSEEGEISLGRQTDQQIRRQYGLYGDEKLTAYVRDIGMAMAPHTHRPQLEYHFSILDTPVANAFAVPGGYIYVTRGLLAMMNSEAELAVVLGHELGHVNARHSMRKMSQLMLIQVGLVMGSAISETVKDLSGLASIGIQLLFLKFSRNDERQADQLGVEYARSGFYNPAKMVDFFQTLKAMGDLSEGQSLPGFLSTHPMYGERIENTQELLLAEDAGLQVKQVPYLQRIQNLIFGPDPRQGYVEDGMFYHPEMRFSFSFPNDWAVQNAPAQVTLVSKDENAAVILQAEKSSTSLPEYAEKKAANLQGSELLDQSSLNINGHSSLQQVYRIPREEQENLNARMTFIWKDPYIYSFTGVSSSGHFNQYDYYFGTIAGSFQNLNDPKYINRSPRRIKLIKANGQDNLEIIFRREGMNEEIWPQFAVMNGMQSGQTPEKGRLIKVLR
jgi:predicted Zn-dependent protease